MTYNFTQKDNVAPTPTQNYLISIKLRPIISSLMLFAIHKRLKSTILVILKSLTKKKYIL